MQRAVHRIVAGVTAAFVLLAGVYCACGSFRAEETRACHAARSAAAEPIHSHCHGSGDSLKEHPDAKHPNDRPSPRPPHDGGSCRHCQSTATGVEPAKPTLGSPLAAVAIDFMTPQRDAPAHEQSTLREPVCRSDLPPPHPTWTLLSLHCALNT